MRHRAITWFALLVWMLCSTVAEADNPTPFPGKRTSLTSPNKQHLLINRDADNDSEAARLGDNHALFLRNLKSAVEKKIHTYSRHIEALWSPDGDLIAITDFVGSDHSACYIYRVTEGKLVSLAESLAKALEGTGKLKNHHVYFQAVAWQKGPALKIKVSGYGEHDEKGFESWCLYDVRTERTTLLRSKRFK